MNISAVQNTSSSSIADSSLKSTIYSLCRRIHSIAKDILKDLSFLFLYVCSYLVNSTTFSIGAVIGFIRPDLIENYCIKPAKTFHQGLPWYEKLALFPFVALALGPTLSIIPFAMGTHAGYLLEKRCISRIQIETTAN